MKKVLLSLFLLVVSSVSYAINPPNTGRIHFVGSLVLEGCSPNITKDHVAINCSNGDLQSVKVEPKKETTRFNMDNLPKDYEEHVIDKNNVNQVSVKRLKTGNENEQLYEMKITIE